MGIVSGMDHYNATSADDTNLPGIVIQLKYKSIQCSQIYRKSILIKVNIHSYHHHSFSKFTILWLGHDL